MPRRRRRLRGRRGRERTGTFPLRSEVAYRTETERKYLDSETSRREDRPSKYAAPSTLTFGRDAGGVETFVTERPFSIPGARLLVESLRPPARAKALPRTRRTPEARGRRPAPALPRRGPPPPIPPLRYGEARPGKRAPARLADEAGGARRGLDASLADVPHMSALVLRHINPDLEDLALPTDAPPTANPMAAAAATPSAPPHLELSPLDSKCSPSTDASIRDSYHSSRPSVRRASSRHDHELGRAPARELTRRVALRRARARLEFPPPLAQTEAPATRETRPKLSLNSTTETWRPLSGNRVRFGVGRVSDIVPTQVCVLN